MKFFQLQGFFLFFFESFIGRLAGGIQTGFMDIPAIY